MSKDTKEMLMSIYFIGVMFSCFMALFTLPNVGFGYFIMYLLIWPIRFIFWIFFTAIPYAFYTFWDVLVGSVGG